MTHSGELMLTNQTRASLVQLLQAISPSAVRLLLLKHLDFDRQGYDTNTLLTVTAAAQPEQMAGLLIELVAGTTSIRADAPTTYVFDNRVRDLRARLRADGYEVIEDALTRLVPAAEPAAQIADHLEIALSQSGLDTDGEVRRLLRESHDDISAAPPDYNGSTTKARIALETIARRGAANLGTRHGRSPTQDSWGAALHFLKAEGVITQVEEDALAKVYTLISPGAHVPRGLTDEQWALLARTFAVSGAYFLARQISVP
jgi:hypothetical protein